MQAQRNPGVLVAPVTAVTSLPRPAAPAEGELTSVARAELQAADRERTAAGQLVLALARRIDQAEEESGASLAALVKEFRASLTASLAGAEQADDPVDQVRKQRERKQRAR